jgi:hypothetical protein
MRRPLLDRKTGLEALLKEPPATIRFSDHVIGNGAKILVPPHRDYDSLTG